MGTGMVISPIHRAEIRDGKIILRDKEQFLAYCSTLKGEIDIIVRKHKNVRTSGKKWQKSNQNGYYWGVVIPLLCAYFGILDPEQMNYDLKRKFNRIGGSDEFPKLTGMSELSSVEFEEKMSTIRMWAMDEYEVRIPQPNEYEN